MSECVVRMKKYGNCLDCDLHQIVYGDSYADTDVYCFKTKRFVGKRFGPTKDLARPDWCPIICSIPEGHGRLVDADAYSAEMKDRQDAAWKWRNEAIAEEDELKLARAEGAFSAFVEAKLTWDKQVTIVPAERSEK